MSDALRWSQRDLGPRLAPEELRRILRGHHRAEWLRAVRQVALDHQAACQRAAQSPASAGTPLSCYNNGAAESVEDLLDQLEAWTLPGEAEQEEEDVTRN